MAALVHARRLPGLVVPRRRGAHLAAVLAADGSAARPAAAHRAGAHAASAGGCCSSSGCWLSFIAAPRRRCRSPSSGGPPTTSRPPSRSSTSTTRRRDQLPARRIVDLLAGFWLVTVAGGWLGVLLPYGELTEPGRAAPARRASPTSSSCTMLVHPIFAQVQDFLGYPLGRPNGAVPLHERLGRRLRADHPVLHPRRGCRPARRPAGPPRCSSSRSRSSRPSSRSTGPVAQPAASRSLYGATRPGDIGRLARRSLLAILLVGLALIAFTPLKAVVEGRAENQHSNAGREFLYAETVKEVGEVTGDRLRRAAALRRPEADPPPGHAGPVLARAVLAGVRRRVLLRGVPRRR